MNTEILEVKDLRVQYRTAKGPVKAVDGVNLILRSGEKFGLVGESGCGKSTMAMALLRLIKPPGRIETGEILLDGIDLLKLSDEDIRKLRFAAISFIPQGAMNSLNPILRVRDQLADTIRAHDGKITRRALQERVDGILRQVGLKAEVARMYPHELSGGMKQRVCIAMAICLQPKVIVADEPSSALDVVVQRQVIQTIAQIQGQLGAAVILIGHDMGLMAQFADRIGVMYAGKLVEIGPVRELFSNPMHPYTQLLIASLPTFGEKSILTGIPGLPPSLRDLPRGCVFHPRCPFVMAGCSIVMPVLREARPNRWVQCHLYNETN